MIATLACVLLYAAMVLRAARWRYAAIRPYTEPLSCDAPLVCQGRHLASCYRRWGHVDTTGEALCFALLTGLMWPLILPASLLRSAVTAGTRPLPEETAAAISRLEAENERLRRQVEGEQR